jgi:hypothetical protein
VIRLPGGYGEQRDIREELGDRVGVRVVVQLADEQAGGWRDDAGRREPTTHDLVVLASHTCRVRRLVHVRHDLAHACAVSAADVAVYPRAGVAGDGSLERICTARDPSDPAAPMTPIVFKGGIGHGNAAYLHNAGVHTTESTGRQPRTRSVAEVSANDRSKVSEYLKIGGDASDRPLRCRDRVAGSPRESRPAAVVRPTSFR